MDGREQISARPGSLCVSFSTARGGLFKNQNQKEMGGGWTGDRRCRWAEKREEVHCRVASARVSSSLPPFIPGYCVPAKGRTRCREREIEKKRVAD